MDKYHVDIVHRGVLGNWMFWRKLFHPSLEVNGFPPRVAVCFLGRERYGHLRPKLVWWLVFGEQTGRNAWVELMKQFDFLQVKTINDYQSWDALASMLAICEDNAWTKTMPLLHKVRYLEAIVRLYSKFVDKTSEVKMNKNWEYVHSNMADYHVQMTKQHLQLFNP